MGGGCEISEASAIGEQPSPFEAIGKAFLFGLQFVALCFCLLKFFMHFEGLFSGCDINDMCFFTIPAVGGSSGSLVYNKNGQVISMIQMAVVDFHSLSMGVKINEIREFLKFRTHLIGAG